MHCVLFRIPPGTTREAIIEKLKADKRVLIVQPLNEFESATDNAGGAAAAATAGSTTPTRGCNPTSARSTSRRRTTSAAAPAFAWPSSTPASTRIIPTSSAARFVTRNYIDTDEVAFRGDRHGTQVAGLIAAAANNGVGIVGVAPDVQLMAYKACWQASANTAGRCNSFTIAQAMADALAAKAQVINLSLVGPERSIARGTDRQGHRTRESSWWARCRKIRASGLPARLPRVLPVAEAEKSARPGRRHPARAGARHRHAGPERALRLRVRKFARHRADHGVVALLLARNQKLGITRLRDTAGTVHREA